MNTGHIDTPVARIGREIQRFRNERNKSYKQIADLCNESLKVIFPDKKLGPVTESRITKIVQAYQNPGARGVARQIEDYELAALPHALKFSLDEALGSNFKRCALIWDPFADSEYSANVLRLLQKHGNGAKQLVGWAEFLPCSMETPEFMEAHHTQLFQGQLAVSAREWRQLMNEYNEIGHRRRAHVLSSNRSWHMKHLMKISDLERIVHGVGEFTFEKLIRKEEIAYLAALIADPTNRMELILAEEINVAPIERNLRDYDSQFTIDERLTVWRSHGGRISWSEDPGYIAQHQAVLDEFEKLAGYKTMSEVCNQLKYYLEMVE